MRQFFSQAAYATRSCSSGWATLRDVLRGRAHRGARPRADPHVAAKDASGGAIPMCGVPYHAGDATVARLVRKGSSPSASRWRIPRRPRDSSAAKSYVVSPGTLTDASYLDAREPAFPDGDRTGLAGSGLGAALLDLSTGEFTTATTRSPRRPGPPRRAGGAASREIDLLGFRRRLDDGRDHGLGSVHHGRAWTFDSEAARRALLTSCRRRACSASGWKATMPR